MMLLMAASTSPPQSSSGPGSSVPCVVVAPPVWEADVASGRVCGPVVDVLELLELLRLLLWHRAFPRRCSSPVPPGGGVFFFGGVVELADVVAIDFRRVCWGPVHPPFCPARFWLRR